MADDEELLSEPLTIPRSEMFRAAPTATSDDIASALSQTKPPASRVPGIESPKRRGRPPGSKNLTPTQRALRLNAEDPVAKAREKAERIKKDAEEMAIWISEELNEHIMTLALQIPGVTVNMLYKEGYAPASTAHISKYTDLGNALAVPASLAKSASKLYAEGRATEQGQALTGKVSAGKAGIIVAAIGTLFGTVQYAKGVNDILQRIKQVQEAQAEWEVRQSNTVATTSEAERMKAGIVG